jgi:hypothetical protein
MSRLSPEATQLLKEATQNPEQAAIQRNPVAGYDDENGVPVYINGKEFGESGSPKSISLGNSALEELIQKGMVREQGEGFYRVTGEGWRVAGLET